MNILKLMQEMRGLAQVTNRRPSPRTAAALTLQIPTPALRARAKQKRIRISLAEPPDIPHPVKITHLTGSALPVVMVPMP